MRKRISKVLAIVGILTAVGVLLFFLDRFVLGAIEAEKKIAAYEEYHYGEASGVDMHFNWKMGSGYIGGGYTYNPDYDLILDGSRNDGDRAYFEQAMGVIDTYDINFEFADYGVITYYDGSDASVRYDDLYIYEFYNTQFVEEEERIERGATLIWETLSWNDLEHYNINGIHVDYYDPRGVIRYSIRMDKDRKSTEDITVEMLIESAKEVSFEENLLIQEKWKKYFSQRESFLEFYVDGYRISLVGIEQQGDYQLIQSDGITDKVITSTYFRSYYDDIYQYDYGTFDDIMGYSGFYIDKTTEYTGEREYYTIINGEAICIADTWEMFDWNGFDENCFVLDVNGDGITELITEVVYGSGGHDTFVYYNDGTKILSGRCGYLLDEEFDNTNFTCKNCFYRPEENVVEKSYLNFETNEFENKRYEIDLNKIPFSTFAELTRREM